MPIRTPCVNICEIDFASRLCTGCGRSRDEVARWLSFSDAERDAIMADLRARMERAGLDPARSKR